MPPITPAREGIRLTLHVQPRAAHSELMGIHGDALKLRIAAPPADGEANRELLRFLGEYLDVPRSSIELISGTASRRKTVLVRGISIELAQRKLGLPRSE